MNLFLPEGYRRNLSPLPWDDRGWKDQYQDSVYERAFRHSVPGNRVLDVGCGSGFKLRKWFAETCETVGVDLPETIDWVRKNTDGGDWRTVIPKAPEDFDILICSDVLEHLVDPERMMADLMAFNWRFGIFSSPIRDRRKRLGPPVNPYHAQEWSSLGFLKFIEASTERPTMTSFYRSTDGRSGSIVVALPERKC